MVRCESLFLTARVYISGQDFVYIRQRNCCFILKFEGSVVLKAVKLLLTLSSLKKGIALTHNPCLALPNQVDISEKLHRPQPLLLLVAADCSPKATLIQGDTPE